jgi:hypothetical protein
VHEIFGQILPAWRWASKSSYVLEITRPDTNAPDSQAVCLKKECESKQSA